jgi:hypothetical protein
VTDGEARRRQATSNRARINEVRSPTGSRRPKAVVDKSQFPAAELPFATCGKLIVFGVKGTVDSASKSAR